MKFPSLLVPGRLVKRYKRFLADVTLDTGQTVTAACPNTGSMLGLTDPGSRVWLSISDRPTRKYPHTWEMIETGAAGAPTLVGINSGHPNRLVAEAIEAGKIVEAKGFATLRREVKYGLDSRIDLLLEDPEKGNLYIEIKNVHMMRKAGLAEFPDSPTVRGVKHLKELSNMVQQGHQALMVYLVQRDDAEHLALASDIDPLYRAAFEQAADAGVKAAVYRCRLSADEIVLDAQIPLFT